MKTRLLAPLASAVLLASPSLSAQTGIRATLTPERNIVAGASEVTLKLVVEATEDTEVDAALINGLHLDATVDGAEGRPLRQAGKGGKIPLNAGTKIERSLAVDVSWVKAKGGDFTVVGFAWPELVGCNAVVKLAPDVSEVAVEDLDLAKTKVVLVTNHGDMTLSFLPDKAPKHVENFVKLSLQGFYDGTRFHRVIRNFMIQGGDPNTKPGAEGRPGEGGPGYTVDAEFNDTKHIRGVLSMARSQNPNSAGSQFFICHRDAPHLDGEYTAFGNLEKGADTLDSIATTAVGGAGGSTPVEPVILYQAIVLPAYKE